MNDSSARNRRKALLEWGVAARRDFPWRSTRDPWAVLVSEVMLQQTQVTRVVDRWPRFVERWPTPAACAATDLAELLAFWRGLGFPRRVRNLHRTARLIVDKHRGEVPRTVDELLLLPGVGAYTARAVAVFAFEEDVGMVDTNVGRILARWQAARLTPAAAQRLADALVPQGRAWDWGQALFDLGAAVCTRRDPQCDRCPVADWCGWAAAGSPLPDPAEGSAAVSRKQVTYEGSNRQARGRILMALEAGPLDEIAIPQVVGFADPSRVSSIVDGLVADGLVGRSDARLYLGEDS